MIVLWGIVTFAVFASMGGAQSSSLADAVDKVCKMPLAELSSQVFTALYDHSDDIWAALCVDNVRAVKQLPDGPARLIALLRHIQQKLASSAQLPTLTPALAAQLRNCCHIIARVCPVVFEDCSVEQVDDMFWLPCASASADAPLGRALVDVCLELMFLPQFCCSSSAQIWAQGLGSFVPKPQILDPVFNNNRHAVVRALLGACSLPLFITTSEMAAKGNRFVSYIVSADSIMSQLVFRSLLNTVLSYDTVGWGLPFGSLISSGATSEGFVSSCCQLLLVLLDTSDDVLQLHASTSGYAAVATAHADGGDAPRSLNMVLNDLTDISDPRDFEFMFNSILTLLTNPLMASSSSIPGALSSISFFQEAIIVLWKLLELHPAFTPFILRNFDVAQLVIPLVFFINEGRKDSAKAGLIHICTFVILLLSGERNFSIALNAPFNIKLPTDLGNVGDLLVIVLSRLVLEHTVQMLPLFDCFFTIIGNISAYIKSFCMTSASKLLQLFSVFSRRKILCASGSNHRYLLLVLETINNIIQYQYEGNPSILLQIISKSKDFEALHNIGAPAKDAASSPRTSLDSQQAEAASAAAAAAMSEPSSRPSTVGHDCSSDIPAFEATDEWLAALRDSLPLEPSLRVLHHLQPHVLRFCDERGVRDEASVVAFLKSTTMVGLLPVPHPILVRKYHSNSNTQVWLTTYIWGIIYLRNQDPLLFDSARVRLFKISFAD